MPPGGRSQYALPGPGEGGAARDPCLVLAVRRAGEEAWEPMHADRETGEDAEALALLHVPDEDGALQLLAADGWVRAGSG